MLSDILLPNYTTIYQDQYGNSIWEMSSKYKTSILSFKEIKIKLKTFFTMSDEMLDLISQTITQTQVNFYLSCFI